MSRTGSLQGHCLCGNMRYSCAAEPALVAICHCRHCQRQTSAPFSLVVAVPAGSIELYGDTLRTFHDRGDSGQSVERRFCGNCGSPILSLVAAMPQLEFIKAGTLDDTSWLEPTLEIWCDTAQHWVRHSGSRQLLPRNPPLEAAAT